MLRESNINDHANADKRRLDDDATLRQHLKLLVKSAAVSEKLVKSSQKFKEWE